MKRTGLTIAAAIAAATALAAPAPAFAAEVEKDHVIIDSRWSDSADVIAQEEFGPDWCGGTVPFAVRYQSEGSGNFQGVKRGDGLWHAKSQYSFDDTFTNTENGLTFRIRSHGTDRDAEVTDNGDGTLSIRVQVTTSSHVYGPDGRRLFHDAGTFSFELLIDHNGTPGDWDDDSEISFIPTDGYHGRFDTWERDFCSDLVEYIG
jgi:hypothetical protein